MARRPHLSLKRLEGELDRRKRPGFASSPARDHVVHGIALHAEARSVVSENAQRPDVGDDPSMVLKINTAGYLDEGALAAMSMSVLSQSAADPLIVFTPDPRLSQFQERVAAYQGPIPPNQKGPSYAGIFSAIDSMTFLTASDRIGPVLRSQGYTDQDSFVGMESRLLDVEMWDPGDGLHDLNETKVRSVVEENDGEWLSRYRNTGLFIARIRANAECVRRLLSTRQVALIDIPPSAEVELAPVSGLTLDDLPRVGNPDPDALCIGVIDSGVTSAHPLLAPTVVGAFGVPAGLGSDDQRGHGTAVAGLATYGPILDQLEAGQLVPQFRVASAKVVDASGEFAADVTVPEIMESAIRRLHGEYGCSVINISLGDRNLAPTGRPSNWAMVLDNLARELDLVITVSAGNVGPEIGGRLAAEGLDIYPAYLLEEGSRVLEPASSMNSVVVGAIAHANGLIPADDDAVDILPITSAGGVAPFSRCGPGYNGAIKPDLVDYGGTAIWQGFNQSVHAGRDSCGILTLNADYTQRLLAYRHGTSFAAPAVAFKAAVLRQAFPEASANLVRALLALAAFHPKELSRSAEGLGKRKEYRLGGYGLVDLPRALASEDVRPVLVTQDNLAVDKFAVYEIPIPTQFQTTAGRRHIRVSLAFDPPARNSRKEYVGIRMGFHLARGVDEQDVFDRFRKWESQDREDRGDPFTLEGSWQCKMEPIATLREAGTLQVGTFVAQRSIAQYGDRYFLVVRCEGGWAADQVDRQEFAVAVELWHEAELEIYQSVSVVLSA